jgi:hypothetical protein
VRTVPAGSPPHIPSSLPVMRVCGLVSLLKLGRIRAACLKNVGFPNVVHNSCWRIAMLMSNLEMECGWSGEMP